MRARADACATPHPCPSILAPSPSATAPPTPRPTQVLVGLIRRLGGGGGATGEEKCARRAARARGACAAPFALCPATTTLCARAYARAQARERASVAARAPSSLCAGGSLTLARLRARRVDTSGALSAERRAAAETAIFGADEVAKHNSRDDCWLIIEGKVYDITECVAHGPARPQTRPRWRGAVRARHRAPARRRAPGALLLEQLTRLPVRRCQSQLRGRASRRRRNLEQRGRRRHGGLQGAAASHARVGRARGVLGGHAGQVRAAMWPSWRAIERGVSRAPLVRVLM